MVDSPVLYCLLDVCIKIDKAQKGLYQDTLTYDKNHFVAGSGSYDETRWAKRIITYATKLDEFSLHIRTDHADSNTEHLSVFFNPDESLQKFSSFSKEQLISNCFETVCTETADWLKPDPDDVEMDIDESRNDVQTLYERLKRAHAKVTNDDNSDLNYLQHDELRPELRPYQLRAVKWMIDRETKSEEVHIPSTILRSNRVPGVTFYMDPFKMCITTYQPPMRRIPPGGLLCDEMGLGKTVEMLCLIMHRKRLEGFKCLEALTEPDYNEKFIVPLKERQKMVTHCICHGKSSTTTTIMCNSCKTVQHMTCVMHNTKYKETFDTYMCPDCWKKSGKVVESKATLIVSPFAIKHQWYSEIKHHIDDPNFRVFIYDGVKNSGWIDPVELASYDVVLTDYTILSSEIHFTKTSERQLRRPSLCAKPVSPLPMIKWYRSCLDEAQMVELPTALCARMVNSLPAIHRWAVTGTPIENQLSTLYGLLYFIGYDPFNSWGVWSFYVRQYFSGNYVPLVKILQKVMWRTCKKDVTHEINIPPQSDVVHYVKMSDLQRFFYNNEHSKYRQVFIEKAAKVSEGMSMDGMSSQTFKSLMEPLRKLRQDCTNPSIMSRFDTQKKLLTPTELNNHMIKNTEIELKTCLRTVSSSLNGLAAVHIMNKNYKLAVASYKSVLKWASDYNDKKIHVDTLLQIHAVHNMLDVIGHLPPEESVNKTQYEQKLTELEWKYIETYKDKVKEVEDRLVKVQREVKELDCKELSDKGDAWWRHVLYDTAGANQSDALLEKITLDMKSVGMQFAPRSVTGVDLHLTTWIDKVNEGRRKTLKHFKDLSYFHGNLKPKNKMTEDELFKIEYLVQSSYQCHLLIPEPAPAENADQIAGTCQMCRIKNHLDKYECIIFNKYFFTESETRGTWNPCEQEYIFKTLLAHAKRSNFDPDVISAGETELKLLEGFKNEFKEYSQYWVEINYTVSAYDELNMCKSRLKDVEDLDDIPVSSDTRRNNMYIPRNMIMVVQHEMYTEKESAELNFVRIKGRLNYLQHLKGNEKPEICPICKKEPEDRYAVLQCGHSMCIVCVNEMARFQRNNLICALCRHTQLYRDVFFVTLDTEVCEEIGSFSPKILRIIREILRIRHEEPTVKIVIFSQWDNILAMIRQALETNDITHVMHRQATTRNKSMIQCFKEGSQTCLLLPLAAGSKGLNLTEATHVFLVEPILNPSEELQAIGRVHRIGQTKPTVVHRFIMKSTIEQTIYNTVTNDISGIWKTKNIKVEDLKKLFELPKEEQFNQPMESE